MDPSNGVWVAPLPNQCEAIYRSSVKFFYKQTIVVLLLDYSNCCWSHIQACYFVLLYFLPNYAGIHFSGNLHYRFAFEKHR